MSNKKKLIAPQASVGKRITEIGDDAIPSAGDHDTAATRRALARVEARQTLVTKADQLAGEVLYFRNYKYVNANRLYPEDIDAEMRFVTKYYPNTKDKAALMVDEPRNLREYRKCLEKQVELRRMGFQHIVIRPAHIDPVTELMVEEMTLDECEQQLDYDRREIDIA